VCGVLVYLRTTNKREVTCSTARVLVIGALKLL
jgi:hypothetical protein